MGTFNAQVSSKRYLIDIAYSLPQTATLVNATSICLKAIGFSPVSDVYYLKATLEY